MGFDIGNLINSVGIHAAGAMPVIQQQQSQRIAAQRLGQLVQQMQQAQSGQTPGFSPYPPANTGTALPNGMPLPPSAPGGSLPGLPGAPMAPQAPGAAMPSAPPVTPYGGPAVTSNNSDPFSYPSVAGAFFGGGNAGPADFRAWEETEKTLRPYGQMQGKATLETQREGNREQLEGVKQGGRAALLQEKNNVIMRGQDKTYQARMAAIAGRGTPQQQQAFRAALAEFNQASVNYRGVRTAMAQGGNVGVDDVQAAADKAVEAQKKLEGIVQSVGTPEGTGGAAGGAGGAAPAAQAYPVKGTPAEGKPDGTLVYDDKGNKYIKKGDQIVPAGG